MQLKFVNSFTKQSYAVRTELYVTLALYLSQKIKFGEVYKKNTPTSITSDKFY